MNNNALCPLCKSNNNDCYECLGELISDEQQKRIMSDIRKQQEDDEDFERFKINELFDV